MSVPKFVILSFASIIPRLHDHTSITSFLLNFNCKGVFLVYYALPCRDKRNILRLTFGIWKAFTRHRNGVTSWLKYESCMSDIPRVYVLPDFKTKPDFFPPANYPVTIWEKNHGNPVKSWKFWHFLRVNLPFLLRNLRREKSREISEAIKNPWLSFGPQDTLESACRLDEDFVP